MEADSIQDMYFRVPPFTRTWLTGVVAVTLGARFGLLSLGHLMYDFAEVFYRLQLWRLLTSFFFMGKLDLSWLINLFMMCVLLRLLGRTLRGGSLTPPLSSAPPPSQRPLQHRL